jgi:hypothetical protein
MWHKIAIGHISAKQKRGYSMEQEEVLKKHAEMIRMPLTIPALQRTIVITSQTSVAGTWLYVTAVLRDQLWQRNTRSE